MKTNELKIGDYVRNINNNKLYKISYCYSYEDHDEYELSDVNEGFAGYFGISKNETIADTPFVYDETANILYSKK